MKNTLTTKRHDTIRRVFTIALVFVFAMAFMSMFNITPIAFAGGETEAALGSVLGKVMEIIEMAAKYIGIVIVLWGVFQIVLAFRREDSEGISKQITTVVVGAVLTTFGFFGRSLAEALGVPVE